MGFIEFTLNESAVQGRVKIKNRKPDRTILFIIKPHAMIRFITKYRKCHAMDIKKPWNFMV